MKLAWKPGSPLNWDPVIEAITAAPRPPDTRIAKIADLHKGTRVLIHALVDLATGEKIPDAFKP